ncbi:MAG TPA: hypothetical protein VF522_13185 [Ramlibacter sp.]|uniref:putative immunity protein n=1 Tax=Ramlibacter sp. TaxID=1917967 RepID=UPI002ED5A723
MWACTSLARLKQAQACAEGFAKFKRHIKKTLPFVGEEDPVPLAVACQSNDVSDVLWGLRHASCEPYNDARQRVLRELACDFAERVLEIFERRHPDDKRPRQCIEVARRFARGEATDEERRQARADASASAASASAAAAAAYAAYAYASAYASAAADAYAAYAYASDAAAAAAAAAAYASAYASASAARRTERQWQLDRLAAVLRGEGGATTSLEVAPNSPDAGEGIGHE